MKTRVMTKFAVLLVVLTCGSGSAWALDQATADSLATNMLGQLGRVGGVFSVPHCGSGALVTALWNKTANSNLVVDAFESDSILLASAQARVNANLLGRNIYVSQGSTLARMPYAENFVDLIAITDLKDADLATVSYVEIERALNPGAKAWVGRATAEGAGITAGALTSWANAGLSRTNALSSAIVVTDAFGTWAVITKVRKLPNTEEWPGQPGNGMYQKDASNNRYSSDMAGFPFLPQTKMKPYADTKGGVGTTGCIGISGGRLFRTVYKSSGTYLQVSRQFNGQLLWEKAGGSSSLYLTPDYYLSGSSVFSVFDAETGTQVKTLSSSNFPPSFGAIRFIMTDQNTVYALGNNTGSVNLAKYDLPSDTVAYCVPAASQFAAMNVIPAMANGSLYFVTTNGAWCYSADTGSFKWGPRKGNVPMGRNFGYGVIASKYGLFTSEFNFNTSPPSESGTFFNADDGAIVWEKAVPMKAWINDSYTPNQTAFTFSGNGGACGTTTGSPRGTWGQGGPGGIPYPPRVNCGNAPWPVNGMMVYPPRDCLCAIGWGTMVGTTIEAQMGACNPEAEYTGNERLEQGPVYSSWTPAVAADNMDWFTHRANNKRNASSLAVIPASPQALWQYHNPVRPLPSDVCSTGYKTTSPTTAGGYVYISGSDGIVKCLNGRTGALVWSYVTGGAVFTAPTIWNGGAYVGAGDGYVYCLEAHTGKLRWRFRAAPTERKMNDWGLLLSTWPVIGGVLVQDGYAYFASGIYDEYGAQVFKVNATTGEMVWQNTKAGIYASRSWRRGLSPLGTAVIAGNKLWVKSRDNHPAAFDLDTGALTVPPDRFVSGSYTHSGGADIGVVGDYLVVGGKSKYFRDGYEVVSLIKTHETYTQMYPILQAASDANMTYWNDKTYGGASIQTLTNALNSAISKANPLDTVLAIGLPSIPNVRGIAGCANGYLWDPDYHGGKTVESSLGWVSPTLSCTATYENPLAVDRDGNIIVTLRDGDVVCYASGTPQLYLAGGSKYEASATISMQAYAYSLNASIARVEFYNGAALLGTVTGAPYIFSWTNVPAGSYSLTAKWYDTAANSASSAATTVTVVPPCSFTATPSDGTAPLTVNFDASAINPPSYAWNFGDGSSATGKMVNHIYASAGTYTATLVANYGSGFTNAASRTITVANSSGNHAPAAMFTASATVGAAPLTVNFDASASSDADGDTLTYTWNWDLADPATGSGRTTAHTYTRPGRYTAALTIDDGRGGTDRETVSITVGLPGPGGVDGLAAWFDATDMDGDGVADAPLTNSPKSISTWKDRTDGPHDAQVWYMAPALKSNSIGTKPAVYFAQTESSLMFPTYGLPTGTNPCTMFVAAKNRSLSGGIAIKYGTSGDYREIGVTEKILFGQPGKGLEVRMPATCDLNSNGKWDNGELLVASALWTGSGISAWGNGQFLGSTSVVYNTGVGMGYVGWAFGDVGEVLIYDRALSDSERQAVENYLVQKWVSQTDAPVNHSPLASFTMGAIGQYKTFDASGSTDSDGDAMAYMWDFGDKLSGVGMIVQHAYAVTGSYTAKLTVSDGNGGIGTASSAFTVTVTNSPAPQIVSLAPGDVTTTAAFLNGTLASTGAAATTVSVYWGAADGGSNPGNWANAHAFGTAPSDGPLDYTWQATGLTPGQVCYYRYCAQNTFSAVWTAPQSFNTLLLPAVNNSLGASNVQYFTAILRGQVTQGIPTPGVNVCWGRTSQGASLSAWENVSSLGAQSGAFSLSVTGLTAGATCYYRCQAANAVGEDWSAVSSFTCKNLNSGDDGTKPVAWWGLDEGGGTIAADLTGNGHNATIAGSPASAAGVKGMALDFDGVNDSISVPGFRFTPDGKFTLSFWFSPNAASSLSTLFYASWTSGGVWVYTSAGSNGTAVVTSQMPGTSIYTNSAPMSAGTWHHYAMVGDSTNGSTVYIDGLPAISVTNNSGSNSVSTMYFGSKYNLMLYYKGKMDEIKIYDRSLSAADVRVMAAGPDVTAFDAWRIRFLGGTNAPGASASDDPDHDGMSNMQEYLAGTDPANSASLFAISDLAPSAVSSNLVFTWHSASGKFYSVDFATSLLSGFTGILSSNIPATPPVNTYTAPVDRAGEFYRIRLEQ